MNTNKKTTRSAETSPQIYARVAGFLYLLIVITSLLSFIFVEAKLIVPGNDAATLNNIMANEWLFRTIAAYDLLMIVSVVILSLALYVILKTVNKNLALLALLFRYGEAILNGFGVLSSLIVLLLLNGEDYSAVFEAEQLQALVGLFLDVRYAAISIVIVLVSLGTIVFCYLFYKSNYIPRILAAWGIFSFSLLLISTFASILVPYYEVIPQIPGIPAFIFEVTIGLWLLIKGVNVEEWEKRAFESA